MMTVPKRGRPMMTVGLHRLLATTLALMTFLALLGWGAYAYSANQSATLSKQRGERDGAIAKITADREALVAAQQQLLSEHQRLMAEQKRLQNELARANAQLAAAREKAALLAPQEDSAEESEKPGAGSIEPPLQAAQKSGVEPRLTVTARANAKARCPPDKFWRVSLGTCVSKKAQPQHYTVRLSR
jgi:septal ring factor EnvC (AmiA/AmiB activator)